MRKTLETSDFQWRKSSYSSNQGGECVEVALDWRKSRYSSGQSGDCAEVADGDCHMHLRDSKNPGLGHFSFGSGEWSSFLGSAGRH
ncbi:MULTISPECIES: DUF397 domain-containing protein [Nocardiopsidaceae]|uniref:DUF397 domain-containing protein n=1 Tax=Streptomonospora nanhaiensis TaxID=1323731 RepID=A0ABY6YI80_9ACTN|nr:DUF397 domain-containing protein [Streptomonospora nanhaiensis]WAE71992.1 DUF397 domain-containing protein [Streptomonospora nanhaiensis]